MSNASQKSTSIVDTLTEHVVSEEVTNLLDFLKYKIAIIINYSNNQSGIFHIFIHYIKIA